VFSFVRSAITRRYHIAGATCPLSATGCALRPRNANTGARHGGPNAQRNHAVELAVAPDAAHTYVRWSSVTAAERRWT